MRIIRRKHDKYRADIGAGTQSGQRMINQGLASQRQILLGKLTAHAGTGTGSGNECVEISHGLIVN